MFWNFFKSSKKADPLKAAIEFIECLEITENEYRLIEHSLSIAYQESANTRLFKEILEDSSDSISLESAFSGRLVKCLPVLFTQKNTAINMILQKKLSKLKDNHTTKFLALSNLELSFLHCSTKALHIYPSIMYMQNLRILQLCCNLITYLPNEITNLPNLRKLSVPRNKIMFLPRDIGKMYNLTDLNFSNNLLKTLPPSFAGLRRLHFLSIFSNKFTEFPTQIIGCLDLRHLHFANNQIYHFPAELLSMPFIRTFECDFDKVSTVPNKIRTPTLRCTLKEMAGRQIVKNALDMPTNIRKVTKEYLRSVQECFYCGGPFFDFYYEVYKEKVVDGQKLLVYIKMCGNHLSSLIESENVNYNAYPETYPRNLLVKKYPRIKELFVITCYSLGKLNEIIEWRSEIFKKNRPFFTLVDDYESLTSDYLRLLRDKEKEKRESDETSFHY